jgi:hypothetical protein
VGTHKCYPIAKHYFAALQPIKVFLGEERRGAADCYERIPIEGSAMHEIIYLVGLVVVVLFVLSLLGLR